MSDFVPKPVGTTPEMVFHEGVHEFLHGQAGKLRSSSTVKVSRTSGGIFLTAKPGSGGGVPAQFKLLHFKQSLGNYFLTYENIPVAKPFPLWNTIATATIYGSVVNFTYPHNPGGGGLSADPLAYVYRKATLASDGTQFEYQGIVPPYLDMDLICAKSFDANLTSDPADTSTPVGTKIIWYDDTNAGRAWTRFSNQSFGV